MIPKAALIRFARAPRVLHGRGVTSLVLAVGCVALLQGAPDVANAGAGQAATTCEALAAKAARRHGIPKGLLRAIARTESGRAQGAWPWTANVRGRGHYFDTRQEALTHLEPLLRRGEQSFDVGCMQLNYRWHGQNFATLDEMIDPARNTEYAARYLKTLHDETGSWDRATRYYHSRTPERGRAYLARVRKAQAQLGPVDMAAPSARSAPSAPRELVQPANSVVARPKGALVALPQPQAYWRNSRLAPGRPPRMP